MHRHAARCCRQTPRHTTLGPTKFLPTKYNGWCKSMPPLTPSPLPIDLWRLMRELVFRIVANDATISLFLRAPASIWRDGCCCWATRKGGPFFVFPMNEFRFSVRQFHLGEICLRWTSWWGGGRWNGVLSLACQPLWEDNDKSSARNARSKHGYEKYGEGCRVWSRDPERGPQLSDFALTLFVACRSISASGLVGWELRLFSDLL